MRCPREIFAAPTDDGWDDSLIRSLVEESHQLATEAQLLGVTELLHIWRAAAVDPARCKVLRRDAERSAAAAWYTQLLRYLQCRADPDFAAELVTDLVQLLRLGKLSDKARRFVANRLTRSFRALASTPPAEASASTAEIDHSEGVLADRADQSPVALIAEEPVTSGPEAWRSSADNDQAEHRLDATGGTGLHPQGNDRGTLPEAETDSALLCLSDHESAVLAAPTEDRDQRFDEQATIEDLHTPPTLQQGDALPSQETAEGPIWISAEELELALEAMASQVLPSIYELPECADEAQRSQLLEDLAFNLGLVGSAMEMLGTPVLSRAITDMQSAVESGSPPGPDDLINWSAALVGFLQTPGVDGAALLADVSMDSQRLDPGFLDQLRREAARIQVGVDPALIRERKRTAELTDISLSPAEDVLPQVLEGMLRELPGNAQKLGAAVRRLIESGDPQPIDEARRVAHTLKGDANTVGVRGLANLTHSLEDLLIELHKQPQRLTAKLGEVLDQAADCVEEIADHLLGRGLAPDSLLEVYQQVLDASNAFYAEPLEDEPKISLGAAPKQSGSAHAAALSRPVAATAGEGDERTAVLSVESSTLDELQRLSGETLVLARQIDQRLSVLTRLHNDQALELRASADLLSKLDDLVSLRGAALQSTALREGQDVDPLEMDQYNELHVVTRRLAESQADYQEYQRRLDGLFMELDALRTQQESFHADLQRVVQRTRMVPFEQISGRLQRIARQTARQLERPVQLILSGTETLIENELLDRVVEPLAHLLRNAIDHGIEEESTRVAAGKPAEGKLGLSVRTRADSIEIELVDDGCGLNYAAIADKARALGMIDDQWQGGEDELARFILLPGFSTKSSATHVSGRGIGMDVVNQRVIDLRGQLELHSEFGHGTRITLRLPVSRTTASVIIVHGDGLIAGAVAGSVERVVSLEPENLRSDEDGMIWVDQGQAIPILPIESLYGRGEGRLSLPPRSQTGLLVRSSLGRAMVVSVREVGDVSSVIVKPISPYLPAIPAVRGMTLLGDGRLAAVVDMGTLVDALDALDSEALLNFSEDEKRQPRVVIADDSLSVRRSLSQLMADAGYEVAAARDGLEALQLIEAVPPALVLLDLEMPKLNGLEVTRFMRGKAQTKHTPVLMITSRASDKYRVQADAAGVTKLLGKPVADDDLVNTVRQLMLAQSKQAAAMEEV